VQPARYIKLAPELLFARELLKAISSGSENLERFSGGLLAFVGAVIALGIGKADVLGRRIDHWWLVSSLVFLLASGVFGFIARFLSCRVVSYLQLEEALTRVYEGLAQEQKTPAPGEENENRESRLVSAEGSLIMAKGFQLQRRALPRSLRRQARRFEQKSADDPLWPDKRQRYFFFWQERLTNWQATCLAVAATLALLGWLGGSNHSNSIQARPTRRVAVEQRQSLRPS
jgi:hypothetical protein